MIAYESKKQEQTKICSCKGNDEKKMSVDNLSPLSTLILVRWKGLEPPTFWFVAKHSIQLSYQRKSSRLAAVIDILSQIFEKCK